MAAERGLDCAPLARAVSGPTHRHARDARRPAARPGSPATRDPRWRSSAHLRPCAQALDRGRRTSKDGSDLEVETGPRIAGWHAPRSRPRQAGGVAARWGPVCVRRLRWPSLRPARVPRVPPPRALRRRRRDEGGQPVVAVSGPQRPRACAVVRVAPVPGDSPRGESNTAGLGSPDGPTVHAARTPASSDAWDRAEIRCLSRDGPPGPRKRAETEAARWSRNRALEPRLRASSQDCVQEPGTAC